MSTFLPRWESILGIIPPPNATIEQRQNTVSLYFMRWSMPPTLANLTFFAEQLLGECFIGFSFYSSAQDGISFFPQSVPGIPSIYIGEWESYVSFVNVLIWQPQDKYGNLLMDNATFVATNKNFFRFFNSYTPAYVSFGTIQYQTQGTGTVFGFLNDDTLYGTGTNFADGYLSSTIFVIDDYGNPKILPIASIQSNTQLTLQSSLLTSVTGSIYYAYPGLGFILDVPNNLDNLRFGS
jgi:hypothetical protein